MNTNTILKQLKLFKSFKYLFFYSIKKIFKIPAQLSFSQMGEDLIISYLSNNEHKFYVDVGGNHPTKLSNSFIFYLNGWTGIVIDANNEFILLYQKERKNDVFICTAVSNEERTAHYHKFKEHEVNTLDSTQGEQWKKNWNYKESVELQTQRLDTILSQNKCPEKIGFLNIDVEGMDFDVLKSIDLNLYQPSIIAIEIHDLDLSNAINHEIVFYLISKNYKLVSYAIVTAIFRKNK